MEHFGENLKVVKYQLNLVRDEFAIINTKPSLGPFESLIKRNAYTDNTYSEYRMEWCQEYREICLKNYDLTMEYYSKLDKDDFNICLSNYLARYRDFVSVSNLHNYDKVEGYYIMVLDKYRQVYIGQSDDIRRRIKQHWSATKAFDRTLLPMYAYETSSFSIDFFRALDTTRIYVYKRSMNDTFEEELINNFPEKYSLNRIGGNITEAIEALGTIKEVNLK